MIYHSLETVTDDRSWEKGRYFLLTDCFNDYDCEAELSTLLKADQYVCIINIQRQLFDSFIP